MKTDLKQFSIMLKELRVAAKLKQTDMATMLGITVNQYQRYEYGTSFPRFADLIAIADYFNVSLDFLCGRQR